MYYALDISKWQGSYDATTAKAQGVNDVILRAAYATSKDICFDEFYTAAKAAGQTVGAYGFATWHYSSKNGGDTAAARAAMVEQTNAWIAICKDKLDGYFAIDQELESGYAMGLTPSQNETLLNECIAMLEAAGFVVCIYCSASWAMAQFDKDKVNADLWIAYYYADPSDPDFSGAPDYTQRNGTYFDYMQSCGTQLMGWQFGRIGFGATYGVASANVDRNLFYKVAGIAGASTPAYSETPIQLRISGYGDASFAEVIAYIGSLGIVCDTSTLGEGYFITAFASSGDQVRILTKCAALGIEVAPYFAPLSDAPAQLAISAGDATVFADICTFVGGLGIVCYTALLDGYIVTRQANAAQQQEMLRENLNWGSTIWVYEAPVVDSEAEGASPEAEPEGEAETLPEADSGETPEPLPEPEPEAETPDASPEQDSAQGNKNEQINALLALIRKLLQKLLDLLS